jgi:hypothetical protein
MIRIMGRNGGAKKLGVMKIMKNLGPETEDAVVRPTRHQGSWSWS